MHLGLRYESPDFYAQALAVLERSPDLRLPENDAFGDPKYAGQKGLPSRSAALESQQIAALARQGVTPLAKSRPLAEYQFGAQRNAVPTTPGRSLSVG